MDLILALYEDFDKLDWPLQLTVWLMHQRFKIQQLFILPTMYLCVLYLSENKKQLLPYITPGNWFL